ncbi:MAG: hypothetical protein HYY06_01360 [Deltaproteobacteria bacterium]|nr:hypothetical protein [Deltaproteobacteria bacterium]
MDERELLIEEAIGAHRPSDPGGPIRPHPAWLDLPPGDRLIAFAATLRARAIEAALDPDALSTTARCVLARILRGA